MGRVLWAGSLQSLSSLWDCSGCPIWSLLPYLTEERTEMVKVILTSPSISKVATGLRFQP